MLPNNLGVRAILVLAITAMGMRGAAAIGRPSNGGTMQRQWGCEGAVARHACAAAVVKGHARPGGEGDEWWRTAVACDGDRRCGGLEFLEKFAAWWSMFFLARLAADTGPRAARAAGGAFRAMAHLANGARYASVHRSRSGTTHRLKGTRHLIRAWTTGELQRRRGFTWWNREVRRRRAKRRWIREARPASRWEAARQSLRDAVTAARRTVSRAAMAVRCGRPRGGPPCPPSVSIESQPAEAVSQRDAEARRSMRVSAAAPRAADATHPS